MTEAEGAGGVRDLITQLRAEDYIADRGLATSLFLALQLGKPLLLEGESWESARQSWRAPWRG